MESSSHHLQVSRTARYFIMGTPGPEIRRVYYVIHGYGQLGEYFIKNFESIAGTETLIVAPEALSRFYLDGLQGRVGASWMTKEDRLSEIEDYVGYLNRLEQHISGQIGGGEVENILFGFSQGCATAWRWLNRGEVRFRHFVLWAGAIPMEESAGLQEKLGGTRLTLAYGSADPYITGDNAEKLVGFLKNLRPEPKILCFEDGHRIPEDALKLVDQWLLES